MPLRAGTAYWATVSGVENVAGVPPAEPYRWEFTTEPGATIESTPAPEVRKYYFFGGQRLAMRKGGVVYYLAGDHLGSTSLTVDAGGNKASELRYKPYGEMRYSGLPGGTPTQYRFTGQRFDTYLNLYHMGARFYDPALSRWLSPDTLVPEAGEPQSFNRYSYVLGNSLRYTDPSGHQGVGPIAPPVPWSQPIDPATAEAVGEALAVGGPYVVGGAIVVGGAVGLGIVLYYTSEWVINGPLGPDYPLPEEFTAGAVGATYPLPEGSTLTLTTAQANVARESGALGLEIPNLETPQLETSAETYELELPTVLEAGKNTPVPGVPWQRHPLPEHQSKPGRILPSKTEPPPEVGPPKWPPQNVAELLVWIMYYEARLAAQADKVLPDVLPFEQ